MGSATPVPGRPGRVLRDADAHRNYGGRRRYSSGGYNSGSYNSGRRSPNQGLKQ